MRWMTGDDLEWIMGRGVCEWLGWPLPAWRSMPAEKSGLVYRKIDPQSAGVSAAAYEHGGMPGRVMHAQITIVLASQPVGNLTLLHACNSRAFSRGAGDLTRLAHLWLFLKEVLDEYGRFIFKAVDTNMAGDLLHRFGIREVFVAMYFAPRNVKKIASLHVYFFCMRPYEPANAPFDNVDALDAVDVIVPCASASRGYGDKSHRQRRILDRTLVDADSADKSGFPLPDPLLTFLD
jgi:hypothetical protein